MRFGYDAMGRYWPARCGTRSGYQRHWRALESACAPCKGAARDYMSRRAAQAKEGRSLQMAVEMLARFIFPEAVEAVMIQDAMAAARAKAVGA